MKLLALLLLAASLCAAGTVTLTLPDVDGIEYDSGFPIDLGVVGTFTYSIPAGDVITSATIGGYWGTSEYPISTAGFNMVIDDVTYTGCVPYAACWYNSTGQRPFADSIPSSEFAFLAGGSVPLDIVQTNERIVRYGSPTLTVNYAVPEPGAWSLMGSALLSLVLLRLRKRRG